MFILLFSLFISLLLLAATRVIIDIGETEAYVVCAVCAGITGVWFLVDQMQTPPAHLLAISLLTLYQSHFVIEDVHALWELEWFMCGVVTGVYLADYYVWYLAARCETSGASGDARRLHGLVCNLCLASMAYIPLHGAGLFNIRETRLLVVFVFLQSALAFTESRRNIRTSQFSTPHPAIKSLPLLYLPPHLWPLLAFFVLINLLFIYGDFRFRRSREKSGEAG